MGSAVAGALARTGPRLGGDGGRPGTRRFIAVAALDVGSDGLGVDDSRVSARGAAAAPRGPGGALPAGSAPGLLVRDARGDPPRRHLRARAAPARRARLERARHQRRLPHLGRCRGGRSPRCRAAGRIDAARSRRSASASSFPSRARSASSSWMQRSAFLVLVVLAGISFGFFWVPGTALLSEGAERAGPRPRLRRHAPEPGLGARERGRSRGRRRARRPVGDAAVYLGGDRPLCRHAAGARAASRGRGSSEARTSGCGASGVERACGMKSVARKKG